MIVYECLSSSATEAKSSGTLQTDNCIAKQTLAISWRVHTNSRESGIDY